MIIHGTREWYVYHFILACTLRYPVLTFEMKLDKDYGNLTAFEIILGNRINDNKHYFTLSSNDSGGIQMLKNNKFEWIGGHQGFITELFLSYFL